MQLVLIPLAILGLFGGLLNLPAYLGGGFLSRFFAALPGGGAAEGSHLEELALQGVAGVLALVGSRGRPPALRRKRQGSEAAGSRAPSPPLLRLSAERLVLRPSLPRHPDPPLPGSCPAFSGSRWTRG